MNEDSFSAENYSSDDEELEDTGEEKAIFNTETGDIVGVIFGWEFNADSNGIERLQPSGYLLPCDDIPLREYRESDTSWIESKDIHLTTMCIVRMCDRLLVGGASGLQLSDNFVGTARHSAEKSGYFFATNVLATHFNHGSGSWIPSKYPSLKTLKIAGIFFTNIGKEKIPKSTERLSTTYDFSMMESPVNATVKLKQRSTYPTPHFGVLNIEEPIIVIGYPRSPTTKQIEASYGENGPTAQKLLDFFGLQNKTASIGRVKDFNSDLMLISCAICQGMYGSPIFTLKGDLIGFLIGSKKDLKYSIALRVTNPVFVIEYLSYPGYQLLMNNPSLYLPLLAPFISNNIALLEKAKNDPFLSKTARGNLQSVLSTYLKY